MAVCLPNAAQICEAANEVGISLTEEDVKSYIDLIKPHINADNLHGWQLRADELSETTKVFTVLGSYIKKYHGTHYYGKAINLTRRLTAADANYAYESNETAPC